MLLSPVEGLPTSWAHAGTRTKTKAASTASKTLTRFILLFVLLPYADS